MSRKDYQKIAETLLLSQREYGEESLNEAYPALCVQFCDMLSEDNSRFDRARFLAACGVRI